MQNDLQFDQLLESYLVGSASPEEYTLLMELIKSGSHDEALKQKIDATLANPGENVSISPDRAHDLLYKILSAEKHTAKLIRLYPPVRKIWTRAAAAAVILLVFSALGYWYFNKKTGEQLAKIETQKSKGDVAAPQTNKAVLTLADGSKIILDSAGNGSVATQGNVDVVKTTTGELIYKGDVKASHDGGGLQVAYNTLTVPKGSKPVQLQLADGSKVWLNVASSITYPTAFIGAERKVEITGEAYFEVSKDPLRKFLVSSKNSITEVLGTHFNINSYDEEASTKITLLEGAVKVTNGTAISFVKPGQQAVVAGGNVQVMAADTEEATAWKNGMFQFSEESLESTMRKVSRWYDVEIEYADNDVKALPLTGVITRFSNVSKVLRMLELTKEVHFKIADKKIIVMK